jgi:hypothetical protein
MIDGSLCGTVYMFTVLPAARAVSTANTLTGYSQTLHRAGRAEVVQETTIYCTGTDVYRCNCCVKAHMYGDDTALGELRASPYVWSDILETERTRVSLLREKRCVWRS